MKRGLKKSGAAEPETASHVTFPDILLPDTFHVVFLISSTFGFPVKGIANSKACPYDLL
jgi:hypothetical protein